MIRLNLHCVSEAQWGSGACPGGLESQLTCMLPSPPTLPPSDGFLATCSLPTGILGQGRLSLPAPTLRPLSPSTQVSSAGSTYIPLCPLLPVGAWAWMWKGQEVIRGCSFGPPWAGRILVCWTGDRKGTLALCDLGRRDVPEQRNPLREYLSTQVWDGRPMEGWDELPCPWTEPHILTLHWVWRIPQSCWDRPYFSVYLWGVICIRILAHDCQRKDGLGPPRFPT